MPRPIYSSASDSASCNNKPSFTDGDLFRYLGESFIGILSKFRSVVSMYVQFNVSQIFIGTVQGKSKVDPRIMVRLMWISSNPGKTFDKKIRLHLLQLKQNYLILKEDWTKDIDLKVLIPASA